MGLKTPFIHSWVYIVRALSYCCALILTSGIHHVYLRMWLSCIQGNFQLFFVIFPRPVLNLSRQNFGFRKLPEIIMNVWNHFSKKCLLLCLCQWSMHYLLAPWGWVSPSVGHPHFIHIYMHRSTICLTLNEPTGVNGLLNSFYSFIIIFFFSQCTIVRQAFTIVYSVICSSLLAFMQGWSNIDIQYFRKFSANVSNNQCKEELY